MLLTQHYYSKLYIVTFKYFIMLDECTYLQQTLCSQWLQEAVAEIYWAVAD